MEESVVRKKIRGFVLENIIKDSSYPLRDDEPLISGGVVDSFALVHLSVFIEEAIGVVLPDTELTVENMDTINDMVAKVLQEGG